MHLSRRGLLGGVVGAAVAAGGSAAAVFSADRGATRHRAMAAKSELGVPHGTRVVWRARTDEKVLALTFDDGPVERYTRPLLDLLESERVPATFAVVGSRAVEQRELLAREVSGRHEIANHSWSHADLALLSRAEVRVELSRTAELVAGFNRVGTPVLRPPYGRLSGTVLEVAAEMGMDVLLWDSEVHEKRLDTPGNVAFVLDSLRPGMVLLAHDGGPGPHSVGLAAIGPVIRGARARGYRFVTASELLSLDA